MPHDDVHVSCVHRVSHLFSIFFWKLSGTCVLATWFGVSGCIRSIFEAAPGSDLVFMWEAWVRALAGFI